MKFRKVTSIVLLLVICVGALLLPLEAVELKTVATSWSVARAEADEETAMSLTDDGDFSDVTAANGWFVVPYWKITEYTQVNAIQLIACGGDTAGDTFSFRILAAAAINGPVEVVCTGTAVLGTQQVIVYPSGPAATDKFWAHSFVITSQWWTTPRVKENNAANLIDGITFDAVGYSWFKIEVTLADGTSTKAEAVSFYWKYF